MPLVSVIIPYHSLKNQEYLDLCLQSLFLQQLSLEVIVVAGTSEPPKVPSWVKLHMTGPGAYAPKVNLGAKLMHPESKFLFIAQDDLIFARTSIKNMIDAIGNQPIILNAMSNCDQGWLFQGKFRVTTKSGETRDLPRSTRLEDFKKSPGLIEAIMQYPDSPGFLFPVPFICTYATLVHKSVWEQLGGFDEVFENGCEDTDFCFRARDIGIPCYLATNAFIFHFSGVTSTTEVKKAMADRNHEIFKSKYGFDLRTLRFPLTMKFKTTP